MLKISILITLRIVTVFILAIFLFSCRTDNSKSLDKLRDQQAAIADKIRELESREPAGTDTSKFRFVGVTRIRKQPFDHFIRVQGKLDGDQNASVFAELSGTVVQRFADAGDKVNKGQVLAQLDDSQVRKQLASLETQYSFATEMFGKQQRLWEQKIGSEVQYLQSKTNKESLENQLSTLKEQIEKFKIKSPITGTVEEVNIRPGTVVSPDPRMPAFRVVSFSKIKVSAEVSEAYAAQVSTGDRVLIVFPDIDKKLEAKLDFVSSYINPVNRTFIIESELPGGMENLKANMIAVIQINDYHNPSAIQLPMNVIQTDLSGSYVFKLQPDERYYSAIKQKVTVGKSYNGMAEITAGIQEGDLVVSTGYQDLIEGENVRFGLQSTE